MQFYFSKREMQQAEKFPLYVNKEKSSSFTFIYVREKQVEYLKKLSLHIKKKQAVSFPFPYVNYEERSSFTFPNMKDSNIENFLFI